MPLSRTTLAALVLLAVAATPALAAEATVGASGRSAHERIVRYWTSERMSSALQRDFVRSGGKFLPAAKGGKPGGGGGGTTVTGATWTKGGTVAQAVGKVFFTMGAYNYTCSGSVATDHRSGYSLVLTAAHCAYDEVEREFATNWMFIPAWQSSPTRTCANTVHGCWTAAALVVHNGYATAGGFNSQATYHDFAFAVVGPGGKSGIAQLDGTVGSFALVAPIGSITKGTQMYAFGFPAAGKYNGNKLTYCAGKIIEDAWNSNKTWGMGCNMTGGSSGGGWFAGFNESTGEGVLGSLNSYGYSGVKNMYGPKFNGNTQAVYDTADGTTSNAIVN